MRIADIRATTVTVPLRHANGCHWGRFARTIVEVETDNGLIGPREMGGGGESAEAAFGAMKAYLAGRDAARLEKMRFLIENTAAALEVACPDIPGGRLLDRIPFATDCFFRYPHPQTGAGEVRTIDQLVATARAMKSRFGPAIEDIRNDYFEDPVFWLNGMRPTRELVRIPLATNTVVVNFEHFAASVLDPAVILLDTSFSAPAKMNSGPINGSPRGHEMPVRTPMGRFGKPEELIGAAVLLASGSTSFITGQSIAVDGGYLAPGVNS
jgi:glucarate dehydratase